MLICLHYGSMNNLIRWSWLRKKRKGQWNFRKVEFFHSYRPTNRDSIGAYWLKKKMKKLIGNSGFKGQKISWKNIRNIIKKFVKTILYSLNNLLALVSQHFLGKHFNFSNSRKMGISFSMKDNLIFPSLITLQTRIKMISSLCYLLRRRKRIKTICQKFWKISISINRKVKKIRKN